MPCALIDAFRSWIRRTARLPLAGLGIVTLPLGGHAAVASDHWAFQPLRVAPGAVPLTSARIDEMLGTSHDPRWAADRRTLARRLSYDLTGLPPRPEEVEALVRDSSPGAVSRWVDGLLASPRYGEHWGRHWLDVVRYADTAGENSDHPLPQAWRYRNWVIEAFNRDQPYDEFVRDQIAGDLVAPPDQPGPYAERIIATGYLALARRFGHDIDQDIHLTFEDAIDNLGKSFLGLGLGCARCHDHKHDPVTMRDYYGLYGILASTRFAFPGCEPKQQPRDLVPLLVPSEVERLRGSMPSPVLPVAYAVVDAAPTNVCIQKRGDPAQPGDRVPRRFLDVLGGQAVEGTNASGRLELARWLVNPANPLAARVMVNRIWLGHFHRGLVPTPNDFGTRGQPPTHPELLDALAAEFMRGGWHIKPLHRLIVLTAAYQRRSLDTESLAAMGTSGNGGGHGPPAGVSYQFFPRRRLAAEEVRDSLLVHAGELDPTPGEAHPFPREETWNFTQHGPFAADYETFRRSVYVMQKRNRRLPFFALFDGPDPNASTPVRDLTTVPTQALYFLNDPFLHARAQAFARRILAAAPGDEGRLEFALRRLFARPPAASERADLADFLRAHAALEPASDPATRAAAAWSAYARVLLSSSEFLHLD